jgi:hypothetical protein
MERERHTPSMLVAIAAIALVIGVAIGAIIGASVNSQDPQEIIAAEEEAERLRGAVENAEDRAWKLYREREALQAQLASEPASAAGVENEPGTYTDGIFVVGEDIAPGTYEGELTADAGYWARLKNTEGTMYSIITNALVTGPFTVTVVESDKALELRGVRIEPAE